MSCKRHTESELFSETVTCMTSYMGGAQTGLKYVQNSKLTHDQVKLLVVLNSKGELASEMRQLVIFT